MGFLSGLGKRLRKLGKIVRRVAPIAATFVPGGGAVMAATRFGKIAKIAQGVSKLRRAVGPARAVREVIERRRHVPGSPRLVQALQSQGPPSAVIGPRRFQYAGWIARLQHAKRAMPLRSKQLGYRFRRKRAMGGHRATYMRGSGYRGRMYG